MKRRNLKQVIKWLEKSKIGYVKQHQEEIDRQIQKIETVIKEIKKVDYILYELRKRFFRI